MNTIKITSAQFYKEWLNVVESRKDHLPKIWDNSKAYTEYIIGDNNSVIEDVANRLDLLCYPRDYYSIDTILYKQEDRTPHLAPNNFWLRDMRVAFEHENDFNSGLFQEVSHLLTTNCDLRVLVTYPINKNIKDELDYLHEIISGNRDSKEISDEESFLIIFGFDTGFEWKGLVYKLDDWKEL